jgi:N-acetylmuramic acid 6-phosphate etherase
MKENIQTLITERSNPGTRDLDSLSTSKILKIMNHEDSKVPRAVSFVLPEITRFIESAVQRIEQGGRLFYVGAGTSGRLGILDASECPPTFGTSPDLVQGIIAGGFQAVFQAVEKAEDDEKAGEETLKKVRFSKVDSVVGLSASGRTPYVIGALKYAQKIGGLTAGMTCNADARLLKFCECRFAVNVGPEVVAGSTRLKCGTAQKLILNMISTGIMIRLGKVKGNRMIDLIPKSQKLWERAKGLIMEELRVSEKKAEVLLRESGGSARKAILLGGGRKER